MTDIKSLHTGLVSALAGLFLLLLCLIGPVYGQSPDDNTEQAKPTVTEQLDELELRFYRVRQGEEELLGKSGSLLDALRYNLDEESLDILKRFVTVAKDILSLDEGAPERGELAARLSLRNQQLDEGFGNRFRNLEGRIAEKYQELDALAGADRAFLAAQIDGLNEQRLRYLERMIDVVRVREQLNFPSGTLEELANDSLVGYANERLGTLQLLKAQRNSLQGQLKLSPGDADLLQAQVRVEQLLAATVARLKRTVAQMERVGLDATKLKRILIEEQKAVSLEMVDADVFAVVFEDVTSAVSEWLDERGPTMLLRVLVFVGVLFLARLFSRLSRRLAQRALDSRPGGMSQLLRDVLVSMVGGTVMAVGVLVALSQVGISLAPMLAGLGVAGFILGFALQDTLSNFAAGGMILAYRPFDVDDHISVAGIEGIVKRMNLVATTITTFDNQSLIVPNSKIWGDVIRNYTSQRVRRVDAMFSISYGDSIEQAEEVLAGVLKKIPAVLESPEPVIRVNRHADNSIDMDCRPWVRTEDYWPTYFTLQREVKLAFDEAGITIPFPQRDVHHFYPDGEGSEQAG